MLRALYSAVVTFTGIFTLAVLGYIFVEQATEMPVAYISHSEGVCKKAQVADKYITCKELEDNYSHYEIIYIK